ncbi:hypothetical protein CHS0354_003725 [Potamilus streckersoni]|uniref:Uncharacterized protein n=1 Tax=Potamilus streckersoni TaxID=2493646 RepID=A0AAE0SNA8_9BIVA|nr:hypothetical protein CHS0354_003725 [Potamilus streckersoni]
MTTLRQARIRSNRTTGLPYGKPAFEVIGLQDYLTVDNLDTEVCEVESQAKNDLPFNVFMQVVPDCDGRE